MKIFTLQSFLFITTRFLRVLHANYTGHFPMDEFLSFTGIDTSIKWTAENLYSCKYEDARCNCDTGCQVTADCCIDFLWKYFALMHKNEGVLTTKLVADYSDKAVKLMKSQQCSPLFPFNDTINENYIMVDSCLLGANLTDVERCYNATRNNVTDQLPVLGTDYYFYKNKYCARCNNVMDYKTDGNVEVYCDETNPTNINGTVIEVLYENKDCTTRSYEPFQEFIIKCKRQYCDSYTAMLCRLFKAPFVRGPNTKALDPRVYKNLYCQKCLSGASNGTIVEPLGNIRPGVAWSKVIYLNNIHNKNCKESEMQEHVGQCTPKQCGEGQHLVDGFCQPYICPSGFQLSKSSFYNWYCKPTPCRGNYIRQNGKCLCPLPKVIDHDGNCITKTCPPGLFLTMTGECVCYTDRIFNRNGHCVCKPGSYARDSDSPCNCFPDRLRNNAGDCICKNNGQKDHEGIKCHDCFLGEEIDDSGECVCKKNTILQPDGTCRCKEERKLNLQGDCECKSGSSPSQYNDSCVCLPGRVRDVNGNCICRAGSYDDGHGNCMCGPFKIVAANGSCVCRQGFRRNEKGWCTCEGQREIDSKWDCVCKDGLIPGHDGNECVCGGNRESDGNGACVCKDGSYLTAEGTCLCFPDRYRNSSGDCVCKPDSKLDKLTMECVCSDDQERNLKGDCVCKKGLVTQGSKCVPDIGELKPKLSCLSIMRKKLALYAFVSTQGNKTNNMTDDANFRFVKSRWTSVDVNVLRSTTFDTDPYWKMNLLIESQFNYNLDKAVVTMYRKHLLTHQYGFDLVRTFDDHKLCGLYETILINENQTCSQVINDLETDKNRSVLILVTFKNGKIYEHVAYCKRYHLHTSCFRQTINPKRYNISSNGSLTLINAPPLEKKTFNIEEYMPLQAEGFQICFSSTGTGSAVFYPWSKTIDVIEYYICLVGTLLSILCSLVLLAIFVRVPLLRNSGGWYVAVMVGLLMVSDLTFIGNILLHQNSHACKWSAVFLYWSLLNLCIWSGIFAYDLVVQFVTSFSRRTPAEVVSKLPKRILLTVSISTGVTVIIILLQETRITDFQFDKRCWFGNFYHSLAFYFVPATVEYVFCFVCMCIVFKSIQERKMNDVSETNIQLRNASVDFMRIGMRLMVTLGITELFGLIQIKRNVLTEGELLFNGITGLTYDLLRSFRGVLIFAVYILNKKTLKTMTKLFEKKELRVEPKSLSTSTTTC